MAIINGTNGNDTLSGSGGTVNGFGGDDTIAISRGGTAYGGDGADTITASGVSIAYGEAGDDVLTGSVGYQNGYFGADGLRGGDGNDTLTGYSLDGGADDDTLFLLTHDDFRASGRGGEGNDYIEISRNYYSSVLGGGGNDTIIGVDGSLDRINGEAGDDLIYGGAGDDTLDGGEGNDTLFGGRGADILFGNAGADVFQLSFADPVEGGVETRIQDFSLAEGDRLDVSRLGMSSYDTMAALLADPYSASDVTLAFYSNSQINRFTFLAGTVTNHAALVESAFLFDTTDSDDTVIGTDGRDDLFGGLGNDLVKDSPTDSSNYDRLFGEQGNDTLISYVGYDTLYGGAGNDELHGGADQNTLHGGEGDDRLYGGESNDLLTGGAGDDTLDGGDGYDQISGGAGADVFVATDLAGMENSAYDHVTDFSVSEGDRLDVSHLNVSDLATVTQLMQDRAHSDGASFTYYRNSQQSETILDGVSTSQVRAGQVILSTVESDDTIYGSDGRDDLFGGLGNDLIEDSESDSANYDRLFGEQGNDTLISHAGYDTLYGGAGDDELHGGADQSTLHGGAGNDRLYGGASNDLLTGGAGDDTLNGGDGYDRISGGAGADVFVATALSDMDGSAYDHVTDFSVSEGDRLDVSHLNVSDLATVTQLMQDRAHSDGASFTYYRNSQQSETILDDVSTSQVRAGQVILSTVESDDTIYGSDGRDDLFGGLGNDLIEDSESDSANYDRLFGEQGNDTLISHAGYDTLYGGAGDDELHGGADQSTLHGGAGNDRLYGGASNDLLTGGAGDDTLNGGDGYDRISGGAGADVFVATALSDMDGSAYDHVTDFSVSEGDRLDVSHLNVSDLATVTQLMQDRAHSDGASFTYYRNSQQSETILDGVSTSQVRAGQVILSTVESDDTIYGSDGRDDLFGGLGNDLIEDSESDSANYDRLFGEQGNDTLISHAGYDTLYGGAGDDELHGGADQSTLHGGEGNDLLYGGASGDLLTGGAGNDTLEGGGGYDTLTGGTTASAQNTFVFAGAFGGDTITDFRWGVDVLDLTGLTAAQLAAASVSGSDTQRVLQFGSNSITLEGIARNFDATGAVTISGTALQGALLSADISTLADLDGFDAAGVTIQWLRDGVEIEGATAAQYRLGQADVGAAITARAVFVDDYRTTEEITSAATDIVGNINDAPQGTVQLQLGGAAVVGEAVSVETSGLADADGLGAFSYAWLRDGVAIAGATGADYVFDTPDAGASIQVRVSYTDGYGTVESLLSTGVAVDHADLTLTGTAGADRLEGAGGNDTLLGLDGTDTLIGGTGNDSLIGGSSEDDLRDVIYGGAGNDYIDGGYGNDELRGDAGNDTIEGSYGADRVIGGSGADVLTGGALGDELLGGDGADFLNGGYGYDRLNGGADADRFYHLGVFSHGSDWVQDYAAAEGDLLAFGQAATADQFQVNVAATPNAGAADVDEAFVIYRPTGQIMWALVDGAAQDSINISISGQVYDLLA